LRRHGAPVRAAARDVGRARQMLGGGIEVVPFDFRQPATHAEALTGARALFLVRPPDLADVRGTITPVVAAARQAGVEHIVFLSLLGVERNPIVPHYRIEAVLRASGVDWTFLRASFFMQNLAGVHAVDIRAHGEVFVPAGHGRTSFIDARDVAAVATLALTSPGHRRLAYPLTGGEALTYGEVATIFSEVLGRSITYPAPSPLAFVRRMRQRGQSWSFIVVMLGIYTAARLGRAGAIAPDTEYLLGRPPLTMRQFVEDHRHVWR
jgi:uncharacterized protein YbjT (DUF2867 family)